MELKVKNFDEIIQKQCRDIIDLSTSLNKMFLKYNPFEKQETDRLMIKLALSVQNLTKIAFPAIGSGEFFGLEKVNTDAADEPDVIVVDRENLQWDFKPWFAEKINTIKKAFEGLLENYEIDIAEVVLAPNSGIKPADFIADKLKFEVKVLTSYSEAILQMFDSGRLAVRDVIVEEDYLKLLGISSSVSFSHPAIVSLFQRFLPQIMASFLHLHLRNNHFFEFCIANNHGMCIGQRIDVCRDCAAMKGR